jgi:hypothetical protein
LSSKVLLWIRIRIGSGFDDFVDTDPDWAKMLDPDPYRNNPDLYRNNPDSQPWLRFSLVYGVFWCQLNFVTLSLYAGSGSKSRSVTWGYGFGSGSG